MATRIFVEIKGRQPQITVIKNGLFEGHGVSVTDLPRRSLVDITGLSLDPNYDRVVRITSPRSAKDVIATRIVGNGRVVLTSNQPLETQTEGDVVKVIVTRRKAITVK